MLYGFCLIQINAKHEILWLLWVYRGMAVIVVSRDISLHGGEFDD